MKSRGGPRADTAPVIVRMPTALIKALDEARRAEEDLPTRPELIRRILVEWAEGRQTK